MNAAITGQILPDSVVLWLLVIVAGVGVWAHAAPRPLGVIVSDALRAFIARINVRTMP